MNIRFDTSRAVAILGLIDQVWQEKTGIFQDVVLPQDRWDLLKNSPEELALFLFFAAIFMRGGIISEDPIRLLLQLKQDDSRLFNPEYVANKLLPEDIEERIKETKPFSSNGGSVPGSPNPYKLGEHSRSWHHNSRVLAKRFQGNPLQIFAGVDGFEEAFARIDRKRKENKKWGIMGMRRKIFSLFTIWLQEKNLIPHFPTPIPVDFHAMRILWATTIIEFEGLHPIESSASFPASILGKKAVRITEKIMDEIAIWSAEFLEQHKISHLHINPAIWTLSRDLCSQSFPNSSMKREKEIILREPRALESPYAWPPRYKNPCLICPIEVYCHGAIPAAPYYKWGLLLKMPRSRHKPLQPLLPHIDPRDIIGKLKGRTKK